MTSGRGAHAHETSINLPCRLYHFVLMCNICRATTYYNTWGKLPLCSVRQSGARGFFVAHTASSRPTFVWLERIIKRTVQKEWSLPTSLSSPSLLVSCSVCPDSAGRHCLTMSV